MNSDGDDFNTVPPCQLVNVCDWVDKKMCIANLAPLPCQECGGCIKYAHHLCANKWAFANNVSEGGIVTYCKDHQPGYQSFIALSMNQLKAPPAMIATSAAPDHVSKGHPVRRISLLKTTMLRALLISLICHRRWKRVKQR